ncbi:MAG: TrkA C-terminal domain-containing protein [Halorientalis sp.]
MITGDPFVTASELLGLAVLAAVLAGAVALAYRWYAHQRIQGGLPVLVGLGVVAAYRGTTAALGQVIGGGAGGAQLLSPTAALFNVAAFVLAGAASLVGVRVGDRAGTALFAATGVRDLEGEVGRIVEAVGRVVAVDLPEDIGDTVGYDPVPPETKASLAGRTLLFPRRLTVGELEDRIRERLRSDYGVGHVDVDVATDGTVEYLALGARAAGIGPTLPPGTVAVAVRADPAFAASAGDVVQVYREGETERVATGELRGVADDVVTLAVDAADADALDPQARYRLVTLPVESRPEREFASLLRAAAETMGVVELAGDSPLAGQPVGALDVSVVAVRSADGALETIPQRTRVLAAGDTVYAVARPDALRRLETAARGAAPTAVDTRDED